jgi:hypothetical protein
MFCSSKICPAPASLLNILYGFGLINQLLM